MIASYVGRWAQAQEEQLELCETLDQFARRLPVYDVDAVNDLAAQLGDVLTRLQQFEEQDLFPLLESMSPQIRPLLVTFRSHHTRDHGEALAIAADLADPSKLDAEGLRLLKPRLAAFAEVLRRHVQFEEAIAMALFASRRVDEKRALQ